MEKSDILSLDGIAVVEKDFDGKVTGEVVGEPTGKRGAALGATIGVAVGLIFPPSVVGAAIVGAGIGGATGRLRGRSGHHAGLRQLGERLDPGCAAVLVLANDAEVDQIAERLTGCEALHRLRVDPKSLAPMSNDVGAATDG
jgi:uncharacterized membrane protein